MDTDLHRQRRNLLIVSLGLVVFETAGGLVGKMSFLNGGITLSNPDLVICLAYIALAYLIWRYWLYAKQEHQLFLKLVDDTFQGSTGYRGLVTPHKVDFKIVSGVAHAEKWDDPLDMEKGAMDGPIPVFLTIREELFRRKLDIRVENLQGNYALDHKTYDIQFFRFEAVWLKAWLSAIVADRAFSDLFAPYIAAFLAVGMRFYRMTFAS